MDNTEKLLRAFIEAQGYEIETMKTKISGYPDVITGYKVTMKFIEDPGFTKFLESQRSKLHHD